MKEQGEITTPAEAEAHREQIAEFAADLWAYDADTGRTDWDDWAARWENHTGILLPEQWDDPAMVRVKKIAREAIAEATL